MPGVAAGAAVHGSATPYTSPGKPPQRVARRARWARARKLLSCRISLPAIRELNPAITPGNIVRSLFDKFTNSPEFTENKGATQIQQRQISAFWSKTAVGEVLVKNSEMLVRAFIEIRDEQLKRHESGEIRFSKTTANRYQEVLIKAINRAIQTGRLPTSFHNPIAGIKGFKEEQRTHFLSAREESRLLKACAQSRNPQLLDIVTFALLTGGRKNEILGLKGDHTFLDADRPHVVFYDTKNGENRVVYLHDLPLKSSAEIWDAATSTRQWAKYHRHKNSMGRFIGRISKISVSTTCATRLPARQPKKAQPYDNWPTPLAIKR